LEGEIMDLSVTPDGRRVVSGTSDKTVRLWDLESGSCLAIFQSGGGAIRSLAVFGQGLVLGSDFGLVEFVGMRGSLPSQAAYWLTLTRLWRFANPSKLGFAGTRIGRGVVPAAGA